MDLTGWCDELQERLPATALAVGASSPGAGRQLRFAGEPDAGPVTGATTFYAASTTKQLVGVLVARAVLDGRIDPDSGIGAYLPGLPTWTGPVRVQHLLHHTAGLPQPPALAEALGHADGMTSWWRLDNAAVLDALHLVEPPSVAPGRAFAYDNTGYVVLAELLRAVEGSDVAGLVRSTVAEPLGLAGSWLGGPAPALVPDQDPPPQTVGDGGLWTCLDDLMTWLEAMNADRLGSDLSALVQTPGRLVDGTTLDYAWGIGTRSGPAGPVFFHGGHWPGWAAMTVRCPAARTAVTVLGVTEDAATLQAAARELHDLLV